MRFKNIDNKSREKKSAGAVGLFGTPQASAAHRDNGRSCVTGSGLPPSQCGPRIRH